MGRSVMRIAAVTSAMAIGIVIASAGKSAAAKTAKGCNAEYAANKDAIKRRPEKG
jgi:hypothetical protein